MSLDILKWIGDQVKWYSELVPKSAKGIVIILLASNIICGFYCYSLVKETRRLQNDIIKSEKEKVIIVQDLKNDFLIYLKGMILVQKEQNRTLDSLIKN